MRPINIDLEGTSPSAGEIKKRFKVLNRIGSALSVIEGLLYLGVFILSCSAPFLIMMPALEFLSIQGERNGFELFVLFVALIFFSFMGTFFILKASILDPFDKFFQKISDEFNGLEKENSNCLQYISKITDTDAVVKRYVVSVFSQRDFLINSEYNAIKERVALRESHKKAKEDDAKVQEKDKKQAKENERLIAKFKGEKV